MAHLKSLAERMKFLRRALITLLAIVVGLPAIGWLLFRMPIGRAVEGEGIAYKKKMDLGVDLRGEYFERPLGKKKLWVSKNRVFFVSADDWNRVWGEEARRDIRYRVHPVLAGFGVAEIVSAENHFRIEEEPGQPATTGNAGEAPLSTTKPDARRP